MQVGYNIWREYYMGTIIAQPSKYDNSEPEQTAIVRILTIGDYGVKHETNKWGLSPEAYSNYCNL